MPDAHKNFAYSTVATKPTPPSSGTSLVVAAGQGALFPAVPFNATVWPVGAQPTTTNAEIIRVTNVSTDTFTIVRSQEGSSARTMVNGDQIAATITAKTLTDVEAASGISIADSGGFFAGADVEAVLQELGPVLPGIRQLFDSTLGADTASIDSGAGGFSTSFDHLLVLLTVRTTEAVVVSTMAITFNNDSGTNYDRQNLRADNATVTAGAAAGATSFLLAVPGSSVAATVPGIYVIWIPSYAQTTFQKQAIAIGGWGEDTVTETRWNTTINRWRDTSAISRIIVTAGSGNLLTGSRLTVYAI